MQTALRSELSALQHGLERRQEIAAARGTLELMQEVAHVASKVEKLLSEVAAAAAASSPAAQDGKDGGGGGFAAAAAAEGGGGGGGEAGDPDAHARLLERVAAEVSRLSFLANKGKVRRAVLLNMKQAAARVSQRQRQQTAHFRTCRPARLHHCLAPNPTPLPPTPEPHTRYPN